MKLNDKDRKELVRKWAYLSANYPHSSKTRKRDWKKRDNNVIQKEEKE